MRRWIVTAAAALVLPAIAPAGSDTGEKADQIAKGVLRHVPADSMGFVYVRDVGEAAKHLDAFVRAVKPSQPAILEGPAAGGDDEEKPFSILAQVKGAVPLGGDFQPGGEMAIVLTRPTGGDGDEPALPKPVFLVPAKGTENLFTWGAPQEDGGLLRWSRDGAALHGKKLGAHVALAAEKQALRRVLAGKDSAWAQVPAGCRRLIARSDLSAWMDLATLKVLMKEAGSGGASFPAEAITQQAPNLRMMLAGGGRFLAAGARLAKDGVEAEMRISFTPGSPMGKVLAAYRKPARVPIDRLPRMKYALIGGTDDRLEFPESLRETQFKEQLALMKGDLPEDVAKKFIDTMFRLDAQSREVQMAVGTPRSGKGTLAAAMVMECASAVKARKAIKDLVPILGQLARHTEDEGLRELSVSYRATTVTVDQEKLPAAEIHVNHPALSAMGPEGRKVLRAFFGEDKLRLVLVQPSETLLVATMGGGEGFVAQAVRASRGGAAALKDAHLRKGLKRLGKRPLGVIFFDVAGAWSIIEGALAKADVDAPPLKIDTHRPFAGAVDVEGTDLRILMSVPSEPAKQLAQGFVDLIGWQVRRMFEQHAGPDAPPPPPAGDF